MSEFHLMPKVEIKAWLRGLICRPPRTHSKGCEPTLNGMANYTGIPIKSLGCLAALSTARMSEDRQRQLSRAIAMVDAGRVVFEPGQSFKRRMWKVVEGTPTARINSRVVLGRDGPKVERMAANPIQRTLPPIAELLGRKLTRR